MEWQEIDTGLNQAMKNMSIDCHLLAHLKEEKRPIIHFYEFLKKSATYGHFIKPFEFIVGDKEFDLARRPTGGGFLLHGNDFAFSILVPENHCFYSKNPLESYTKINSLVLQAIQRNLDASFSLFTKIHETTPGFNGFCLAKPTIYDIASGEKKIGGAAERKVKFGLLHQGSLNLLPPSYSTFKELLGDNQRLWEAMQKTGGALLDAKASLKEASDLRSALKSSLREIFFNS